MASIDRDTFFGSSWTEKNELKRDRKTDNCPSRYLSSRILPIAAPLMFIVEQVDVSLGRWSKSSKWNRFSPRQIGVVFWTIKFTPICSPASSVVAARLPWTVLPFYWQRVHYSLLPRHVKITTRFGNRIYSCVSAKRRTVHKKIAISNNMEHGGGCKVGVTRLNTRAIENEGKLKSFD